MTDEGGILKNKMKIIYYEVLGYREASLALLSKFFEVISLPDPRYDTPEILKGTDALLAPLGFLCDATKIDMCERLKVIGSNTTGEPHIDRLYAEKKGITVISLAGEKDFLSRITPTAEHTIGLLLAVTRHLPWAFQAVLSGTWNRRLFGGQRMLSMQSLGIVGLGRLGSMVARYGQGFGMSILYYDPYLPEYGGDPAWTRCNSLEKLVSISDVVSLHVPANEETKNMINAELFSKFRSNAYFINTARGEIVDELALLSALKEGRLAGAAVDVLDGEFQPDFAPQNHPLVAYAMEHDNLVITPHIGGSTEDAWALTEQWTINRMYSVLREKI